MAPDYQMNVAEVAQYLRRSKSTIYRYTSKHLIPFTKAYGKLLFEKSIIDAWLLLFFHKSVVEIEKDRIDDMIQKNHRRRKK